MSWKMIDMKDYKDEPLQFVGVYVLRWQPQWGTPSVGFVEEDESDELSILRTRVEELEQAAKQAIPYLENCAKHHRDDYVLEDVIIPQLAAALAKGKTE